MGKEKWSGLKLTEEEKKELAKHERLELIGDLAVFFVAIVIAFILLATITALTGGPK